MIGRGRHSPNNHQRGPSLDTNNIDFGNYLDLYSEPVKKLLKSQLEEKLDRKRRPTIDELQHAGIWHPPDPNGPISNPRKRVIETDTSSHQVNKKQQH